MSILFKRNLSSTIFSITLASAILAACGGGGGPPANTGSSSSNTSVSSLSFPLQSGLKAWVMQGSSVYFTVSGSCSGTANLASSAPTSATFEAASAVSVSTTQTLNYSNCAPSIVSGTSTDYYDTNYLPIGSVSSGRYDVYQSPPILPSLVKVGDSGTIGTQVSYVDSSKTVANGNRVLSYVIEPDTADTAIVNFTSKSYNTYGLWESTEQDKYKIAASGTLTYISSELQRSVTSVAAGAPTHLILSVIPDTAPPFVFSTNPQNTSIDISRTDPISVSFSKTMDATTINLTSFVLKDISGNLVPGSVTSNGTTATFAPVGLLAPNALYTATITTNVKDLAGNPLPVNFNWNFTTVNSEFKSRTHIRTTLVPEALAIGDINGDGRNDIVVTTSYQNSIVDNTFYVYIQNANGELNTALEYINTNASGCLASSVAIGDVNSDGKNDVVIGYKSCGIQTFVQNISGGFNAGVVYPSVNFSDGIRIADLNNDGLLDVVAVGWGGLTSSVSIWLQNASGTLNPAVPYNSNYVGLADIDVGDVNSDGLTDIVILSGVAGNGEIGVLTQTPGGTFNGPAYYTVGSSALPWGVAVGDVTGDGLNDVVVTLMGSLPTDTIGIFAQNSLGTLDPIATHQSYNSPGPVEIADITGDGRKDIAVIHGGWITTGVYQQQLNGTLSAEHLYQTLPGGTIIDGNYNPNGFAIGDINGDGRLDAVSADRRNIVVTVLYHY